MVGGSQHETGTGEAPRVSVALPVYNGSDSIRRTIDSVLTQSFDDLELVIADNASTDDTEQVCRQYAAADPRVRYARTEENVGLLRNFNRSFELSSGELIRWIGVGDKLAPTYCERTVAALDRHPDAIGVTTYIDYWDPQGNRRYEEYEGPRPDSPDPVKRFALMLWFFQASSLFIDPIYSLIRRDAMPQTGPLRLMLSSDQILAAELALAGPFCHVPECLASRGTPPELTAAELMARLDPSQSGATLYLEKAALVYFSAVNASRLGSLEKLRCHAHSLLLYARHKNTALKSAFRRLARPAYRALKSYLRPAVTRLPESSTRSAEVDEPNH